MYFYHRRRVWLSVLSKNHLRGWYSAITNSHMTNFIPLIPTGFNILLIKNQNSYDTNLISYHRYGLSMDRPENKDDVVAITIRFR